LELFAETETRRIAAQPFLLLVSLRKGDYNKAGGGFEKKGAKEQVPETIFPLGSTGRKKIYYDKGERKRDSSNSHLLLRGKEKRGNHRIWER